jgi:hypothetical protein
MPGGSMIQNTWEIKELCIWSPTINLIKIYNAGRLDNSKYMGN